MYLPKIDPNDPDELTRIELCGQVCSDFQMSGQVDIQYRCPDQG
jgi:threonyl-tRNA synthetase